ncbi:MAG: 6-phospho-beta-glucosidase, partial [Clostridia bacterium]|nr:6-phospho-beta-glucosidase [Clostridia bacterium]
YSELPITELWLVDIKEGEEKLNIIGHLAIRMLEKAGIDVKLNITLDRAEALKDADFVVTQFRVGGLEARARDERFPLKYDVIGQETTGPGGMAKALRTIPVMLDICRDMESCCPDAWLINFTNPAGMVTEAVLKHTNIRCIGLCNVPINMVKTTAKLLEADSSDIYIDFTGLNHLVWGRKILLKGKNVTDAVLQAMLDGNSLNMKNIPDLKWSESFIKALGMLPCPYHRYYYMKDMILQEEKEAAAEDGKGTRAEQVKAVEKRLFELYKDESLKEKPKELESRGGAYYSDAAVSLISAIYNDKKEIHTVNTRNNGTIKELPEDCVIETNCVIDRRGATPMNLGGAVPASIIGLIQRVKCYEVLTIEAAVKGNRDKALLALANHPLVPSVSVAEKLLSDLLDINRDYLPQFKGGQNA